MSLKMKDLVRLSDTPKSTILYYIKEGLLPEPKKPKPNVHIYDESFVDRIKFIKYLQHHFNASIEQIKELMSREDFDSSCKFSVILKTIDMLMMPPSDKRYTKEELCKLCGIEEERLDRYIDRGLIFDRGDGFSQKEVEILQSIIGLEDIGGGDLIDIYLESAKNISKREIEIADRLLAKSDDREIKTLLDAVLLLKPYLFNLWLYSRYSKKD